MDGDLFSIEPGGGGGGGPSKGRIVPSDAAIVLYGWTGTSAVNHGNGGALPFSVAGTLYRSAGRYTDGAAAVINPRQASNGGSGGALYSGPTTIGEGSSVTICGWVWLCEETGDAADLCCLSKTANQSAWSSPYASAGIHIYADGTPLWIGGGVGLTGSPLALNAWHHLWLTCDGVTLSGGADGALVATAAATANDWGAHGNWQHGGLGFNSGFYHSPAAILDDWRVYNVIKPVSFFAQEFAT